MKPIALACALSAAVPIASAAPQCPEWSGGFHLVGLTQDSGLGMRVDALARFDDGSGEALYIGGNFDFAADTRAASIARWDGAGFEPLGAGVGPTGTVRALAVFDDGSGPALFVGGKFSGGGAPGNNIAKWDGTSWSQLGAGVSAIVEDLEVFDDGSGPALYVAVSFPQPSGPGNHVWRWNGSWSPVNFANFDVHALCTFDDGNGAKLYAAGFDVVLRLDGGAWSLIGTLAERAETGYALEVFDDGSGPALYLGGSFDAIDGVHATSLARRTGNTWQAVSQLTGASPGHGGPTVFDLRAYDDGGGTQLYAAGVLTSAGGNPVYNVARFDGAAWERIGMSFTQAPGTDVRALEFFDSGAGPTLIAGGRFTTADGAQCNSIARWDTANWKPLDPVGSGIYESVNTLVAVNFGGAEQLYAAGNMYWVGGEYIPRIARWDGAQWHFVADVRHGVSAGSVYDAATFDDGSGEALYVSGGFTTLDGVPAVSIGRFDGTNWSAVGSGLPPQYTNIVSLEVHDDGSGPALYAAGGVTYSEGYVLRWNGSSWSVVGGAFNDQVTGLAEYDDGTGTALYACGWFSNAGGTPVSRIARWDGSSWSALGAGIGGVAAREMAVFDDGTGAALYVSGGFTSAGGQPAANIAKWNGLTWAALGSGVDNSSTRLVVWDDGNGEALYVCGAFNNVGGQYSPRFAKWSASGWTSLAGVFVTTPGFSDGFAYALAVYRDGLSPNGSLYVGGNFDSLAGVLAQSIGRLTSPCACGGTSYCTSGTTSSGCVPSIAGIGRASASASSGFEIRVTGVEGAKTGYIVYSATGPNAFPWGASSHFLCVKAPTQRTGTQPTGGVDSQCDGVLSLDWNQYVATHPSSLGVPFAAGADVWAQGYFRDPPGAKTTALSNGLLFTVCP